MPSFEDEYGSVFTPGAPVSNRKLLFGRDAELQKLRRYLQRPGYHPMIIGDRGVGKTSLAVHALRSFEHVIVGCDEFMNFNDLAHAALRSANVIDRSTQTTRAENVKATGSVDVPMIVKLGADTVKGTESVHRGPEAIELKPWDVFDLLRQENRRLIVVLDEYDQVDRAKDTVAGTARLIKNLADNHRQCDSRVLLIGIARTAQQLLGHHPSIQRSLREVFLRPLTADDVLEFLERAEKRLNVRFLPSVKKSLVAESNGFPYFVHLVGLECLDVMTEGGSHPRIITEEHYELALHRAVQEAYRSELQKWRDAVQGMTPDEVAVVKEIVSSRDVSPSRAELNRRLTEGRIMRPEAFSHALVRLQQEKRLVYLSRGTDHVRFYDPLMKPFLRILLLPAPFSKRPSPYVNDGQLRLFEDD